MRWLLVGFGCMALAGCGKAVQRDQAHALAAYDVAQPPALAAPLPAAADAPTPITVTVPQIAYSYKYAFRLPEAAVSRVQAAHVALCDRLGPTRCLLVASQTGSGDDQAAGASLKLRVASSIARRFGAALQQVVAQQGGRAVTASIAAEDVSKDIVDTDARLRQRTLLVRRLTDVLRTHNGKVAELVEAERSVAAAQEEIDQAKGELADLRGRVAMSTIDIDYQSIAASPAVERTGLRDASAESWSLFVFGLAALVRTAIYLLPWAVLAGAIALGVRTVRRRAAATEPD